MSGGKLLQLSGEPPQLHEHNNLTGDQRSRIAKAPSNLHTEPAWQDLQEDTLMCSVQQEIVPTAI